MKNYTRFNQTCVGTFMPKQARFSLLHSLVFRCYIYIWFSCVGKFPDNRKFQHRVGRSKACRKSFVVAKGILFEVEYSVFNAGRSVSFSFRTLLLKDKFRLILSTRRARKLVGIFLVFRLRNCQTDGVQFTKCRI